jgi:prepilin-type N-terminal cleavage/methylation domain-containing protein
MQQKLLSVKVRRDGFTIVELLIVIVVIAILAAIVIIAYTDIQNKAHAAAAQSAASDLGKLLGIYNTTNGTYPTDLTTVNNGQPMSTSGGTSYAYHPGAGNTSYCVTVTNSNSSYKVTDTATTPVTGGCPGDGVGGVAAVTNLVLNPSLENDTSATAPYDAAPISIDRTTAAYGSASALVTTNTTAYPQGMIWTLANGAGNTTYTCSISLKGTAGQAVYVSGRSDSSSGYQGEGYGSISVNLSSSWQRVTTTFTTPANATTVYLQYRFNLSQSGMQAWGDGVFCAQGNSSYNYADGSTANWIWNGTANNSSSTGPPQ